MNPLLEVRDIEKRYGSFQALSNVTFDVADQQTYAIIGPNGAGKTTLFRVMTGETFANSGTVTFLDEDISRLSADQRVGLGMGRTFQVARVFPEHSAMDNLIVAIEARERRRGHSISSLLRLTPRSSIRNEAAERIADVGLATNRNTEARQLSLGDRKRLELALTLALDPIILMLDEPTAGMSRPERHGILDLITKLKAEHGLTILVTEHDMDFVFRLAERLMVMNQGQVVAIGSPQEIRNSELVREIYLGKELAGA